jgi:hypothetical protein
MSSYLDSMGLLPSSDPHQDSAPAPVAAVRLGPGQFLLAVDDLRSGTSFWIDDRIFTVVSEPCALTKLNYLVTVRETAGPDRGRQLRVQVRLGRQPRGSATSQPGATPGTTRAGIPAERSRTHARRSLV